MLNLKFPTFILLGINIFWMSWNADAFGQWDPPANFYSSASGSGATLKNQIRTIMTSGHNQRTYGDFRFSTAITDRDPNNASNILLVYDRSSVSGNWNSGSTWNREHVWPQARQPGSATNGSQGNLGDPHALRPSDPVVNSDRANKPFGFDDTFGSFGSLGSYWFPGDICKGDIARSLFYSETRWSSSGLTFTNNFPSGNQMGELSALIAWHYLDAPDEFERRRNHVIFSSSLNPNYFTNNRNAYIDRPEYVWSIYMDQQNDSMILIDGGIPSGGGTTTMVLDFGAALVGTVVPTNQDVTLDKFGNDGTYFVIEATGLAETSIAAGERHAFRTNGTDSVTVNVSLDFNPNIPGLKNGFVTIDNLDVTTQGGLGRGANDGDDFIIPMFTVFAHSNASFDNSADQNSLSIDLGQFELGDPISDQTVSINNLISEFGANATAGLDLLSVSSDNNNLTLDAPLFSDLEPGSSQAVTVSGAASSLGNFSTQFTLGLSDVALPGATSETLTLDVSYEVIASNVLLGDVNMDGVINLLDVAPFIELLTNGGFQLEADVNEDGSVNLLDVEPFVGLLAG